MTSMIVVNLLGLLLNADSARITYWAYRRTGYGGWWLPLAGALAGGALWRASHIVEALVGVGLSRSIHAEWLPLLIGVLFNVGLRGATRIILQERSGREHAELLLDARRECERASEQSRELRETMNCRPTPPNNT